METLAREFPALAALKKSKTDRVTLVNQTIVEEVLQDLGVLDFGKARKRSQTCSNASYYQIRARDTQIPQ